MCALQIPNESGFNDPVAFCPQSLETFREKNVEDRAPPLAVVVTDTRTS